MSCLYGVYLVCVLDHTGTVATSVHRRQRGCAGGSDAERRAGDRSRRPCHRQDGDGRAAPASARRDGGRGARIPSERDLAVEWGVARMTVRNAIEILIKAGQLERRPGAGTFVVEPPYAKTLGLSSFTDDMRSRGRPAVEPSCSSSRCSEQVPRRPPAWASTTTNPSTGSPASVSPTAKPIAVETNWIPVDLCPTSTRRHSSGSLFALLNERYGIRPGEATSTIDAVLPDAATAAALGDRRARSVPAHPHGLRRPATPAVDGGDRLLRRVALPTPGHPQRQRLRWCIGRDARLTRCATRPPTQRLLLRPDTCATPQRCSTASSTRSSRRSDLLRQLCASAIAGGGSDPRDRNGSLAHARRGAVLPGRRVGGRQPDPRRASDVARQRRRQHPAGAADDDG